MSSEHLGQGRREARKFSGLTEDKNIAISEFVQLNQLLHTFRDVIHLSLHRSEWSDSSTITYNIC